MSEFTPHPVPSGIIEENGRRKMVDAKGREVPLDLVRPQDQLQDEQVRKIAGYALALSDQLRRFKEHTFDDISDFEAILAQEYGTTVGGAKGNKTLTTYDGLYQVQVQVQDRVDFGPELQIAKGLIDECLNEWSADSRPEIQAIVTRAFNTDKEGQINRAEIFMLLRLDIADARWNRAMDAIRDAMRVVGKATYVRVKHRPNTEAPWQTVVLDLAKV
ncbi:hypothetical protein rosmuc_03028 [Roseovarius mucosus DSM 17069]|uniref:Sulfate transporter n=1 Tax=Roseovarius mucosus DSM 17069 TaxID=1288298 RepID=A0A0A0HHW0_9RHOB|nr:DUF3164 family protein [Roseovarius mucosus]KGM86735.1 hypothetical protein rosmuc_03028 [Roseovarius mucosus DSM 17069]